MKKVHIFIALFLGLGMSQVNAGLLYLTGGSCLIMKSVKEWDSAFAPYVEDSYYIAASFLEGKERTFEVIQEALATKQHCIHIKTELINKEEAARRQLKADQTLPRDSDVIAFSISSEVFLMRNAFIDKEYFKVHIVRKNPFYTVRGIAFYWARLALGIGLTASGLVAMEPLLNALTGACISKPQ